MTAMDVKPLSLFFNLTPDCKPIAVQSRQYTSYDAKFTESETQRLLAKGIIEPSTSPWRAQVLVTADEKHKQANGYRLQSDCELIHSVRCVSTPKNR